MFIQKIYKSIKRKLKTTYSMQFRFLATVLLAIFAITVFIGGLSIYEVDQYIQNETENFVKVTCENEGTQINDSLGDMEKSVKIMESYVMGFLTGTEDVTDSDLQDIILKGTDVMFSDVARYTSGAIAYYLRFDPAISDGTSGVFYSKLNGSDEYIQMEPTDILLYEKDDIEHVGWFWQPYEAGKPVWMLPYYNQNNHILMISYVVPMYYQDTFVGVVGMDFDYKVLIERVHEIGIYEHGFARLEMDGVAICDEHSETAGAKGNHSETYLRVSKQLVNGMTLVLSANYDDIRQIRYDIAFKILFGVLILSALFTIIAVIVVKKVVNPLRKLTDASIRLSQGHYDVTIEHSDTYEIKLLSTAFENMAKRLQEREELLHLSANRDSLTSLRNTTSYKEWMAQFDAKIKGEQADFGVIVLDINELKETNDKYGHHVGNELIATAAKVISDVFARSPVFRIGGDEFLVVLQNQDLSESDLLLQQFDFRCANTFVEAENSRFPIWIAKGFARFEKERDLYFLDVFKRADAAMYENKRKMKNADISI